MKKILLFTAGLAAANVLLIASAKADVYRYGDCTYRNTQGNSVVYDLHADFTSGYPSIGTDQGGHNFLTGEVLCDGRFTRVQTQQVTRNRVTITIDEHDRNWEPGRNPRRARRTCVVDASMHWQTTRFSCRR